MKRGVGIFSVVLICLFLPSIAFSYNNKPSIKAYLEELSAQGRKRVFVIFKDGVDPALVDKYGGRLIRSFTSSNALVCEMPQVNIELLKREGAIKDVAPDMMIEPPPERRKPAIERRRIKRFLLDESSYLTADSGVTKVYNDGTALSYNGPVTVRWNNLEAGLNSKAAWDNYNLDGTGIKIAFIDSGINYTLENLDNNYLGGHDFLEDDDDPMPLLDETDDHGTEVASLAVGEGVNKVVGVAFNASYYSVRVSEPVTGILLLSDLISAIEWATDPAHKADIISMSLSTPGGGGGWPQVKQLMENAVDNAYNNGIVLVAASSNEGAPNSEWPAAFDNVISVGAHTKGQTIATYSNGGVDIVTPGGDLTIGPPSDSIFTVGADNFAWWVEGTSVATPHASALIALQMQYARQNSDPNINNGFPFSVNNGYLWEAMKHSAVDLGLDITFQGKGKIWAAETNPPPPIPKDGAIDLMSSSIWPFADYAFAYFNEAYWYWNTGYFVPAYYIGTSMSQDITLTNATDTAGNAPEFIENLNVTTAQAYFLHQNEDIMPGLPIEQFPTTTIDPGQQIILSDSYFIPFDSLPGLNRTMLDIEFNFFGDPTARLIKITTPYASIWCPPEEINQEFVREPKETLSLR